MSIFYESSGFISVNGFLHLYRYFYITSHSALQLLQSFARTTSVALAIELFFTSLSLAIGTRYQNMPVTAVWRRRWKKHIVVAIVNAVVIGSWLSSSIIFAAVVNNEHSVGKPKDFCQMPFESWGLSMDLVDQIKRAWDFRWRRLLFTLWDVKRNCKRHAVSVNVHVIPGTIRTLKCEWSVTSPRRNIFSYPWWCRGSAKAGISNVFNINFTVV